MARVKKSANEYEINTLIGSRLRLLRETLGVTQQDLAGILGISFQQVQKYETGKNRLRLDTINEIANEFSIKMASLVEFLTKKHVNKSSILEKNEKTSDASPDEGLELAAKYNQIKDEKLKSKVRELIETLSDSDDET